MRVAVGLLGAAIALSAPAAFAQAPAGAGFYLGASIGQSQVDLDCSGTTSCDDKDTSWKIVAGYQVNRHFAVEFAYSDFGEASASTPPFPLGLITVPAANATIESTAFELTAVGLLPIAERFSVFGKLGLYRAETDVNVSFAGLGTVSDDDDNTDLTFGVGLRYDFTRNLGVRAEWQRYTDVKAGEFGESDLDVVSIGILWRF